MLLCFSYLCAVLIVYTLVSASFIKVMLYLPVIGAEFCFGEGGFGLFGFCSGCTGRFDIGRYRKELLWFWRRKFAWTMLNV